MPTLLPAPTPPRSPWQLFYGAAHRLRHRWYGFRARRLPRPVVSVGNLHFGGAGKTPLVAAVAERLRDMGLSVTVLSRGYGRRESGIKVVSTGEGPLLGPTLAGDEPVLLAGQVPGVSVVVGEDRYQAGLHALQRLEPQPDIFLLDDGFSHLKLYRDLDLLAFPASDPFAGGRLLPGGRLREPLSSAARADAALLTGASEDEVAGEGESGQRLAAALRPFGFRGHAFASAVVPSPAQLAPGHPLPSGGRVLLVSAIARPERFRASVQECGFEVADEIRFGDHHGYPARSLERIERTFLACGAAAVLTTSKDRVKLHGRLEAPLAELPIRAEPEEAFWAWLEPAVRGLLDA